MNGGLGPIHVDVSEDNSNSSLEEFVQSKVTPTTAANTKSGAKRALMEAAASKKEEKEAEEEEEESGEEEDKIKRPWRAYMRKKAEPTKEEGEECQFIVMLRYLP